MECYEEVDLENFGGSQSTDVGDQKHSNPSTARAKVHLTTKSAAERLFAADEGRPGKTQENVSNEIALDPGNSRYSKSSEASTKQQVERSRGTNATPSAPRNVPASRFSRGRNSQSTSKRQRADRNRNVSSNTKMKPFVRWGCLGGAQPQPREDACPNDSKDRSEARAATKLRKTSQLAESVLRHLRSISNEYSPVFER